MLSKLSQCIQIKVFVFIYIEVLNLENLLSNSSIKISMIVKLFKKILKLFSLYNYYKTLLIELI